MPRYFFTSSGCSRIASDIGMKMTPAFFSSSLKVVATETESNTASTATRRSPSRTHDAGEDFLLAQRNAELLVGLEDFRIDFVERRQRILLRRRIVIGVLIIDLRIIDACPSRLAHGEPALKGFEPPGQHPFRLILFGRNETDGIFRQALRGLLGFDIGDEPVFILVNVDTADLFDGLLYGRHSSLRSRFQGPRVGFVGYGRSLIALRSSQVSAALCGIGLLVK